MIEKIVVIQEKKISRQPIFVLNRRGVDLWNARVEEAESGADDQRPLFPDGVRKAHARRNVLVLKGTRPASGHKGFDCRPLVVKVCRS